MMHRRVEVGWTPRAARRTAIALCAGLACLLARTAPAAASPLFELVGDAFGQGGLNARASSRGAAASYFNPALLADAPDGLTLGFFVLSQQVRVQLQARSSSPLCINHACDVPSVNGAAPESFRRADNSTLMTPSLPTAWLEAGLTEPDGRSKLSPRPRQHAGTGQEVHSYAVLGLVNHIVPERFALAFYAMFPSGDLMRPHAFYSDEREQFFSNSLHPELYGDRLGAAAMVFGAGLRLSDAIALGAGLDVAMQSAAQAPVYVSNLSDLDSVLLDSDVSGSITLSPHVGLTIEPVDSLRLAFTLHTTQSTDIETRFSYVIATGIEQRASQTFTHSYMPATVALGAELGFGNLATATWSLVAGATYGWWSQYRDRHGEEPTQPYAWANTLAASVGMRHNGHRLRGFLDLAYTPSPVPAQIGRSNYVDNTRASASLGAGHAFELWGLPFEFGANAQFHLLLPRDTQKLVSADPSSVRDEVPDDAVGGTPRGPIPGREGLQTNNPGFPGFSSDGLLWGAGVYLQLDLR